MRHRTSTALFAAVLVLIAGCGTLRNARPVAPAPSSSESAVVGVAEQLRAVQRLMVATPIEQAAMAEEARLNYVAVPTPGHRLRYALVLATPGHEGFDPATASGLLTQLLVEPDTLSGPARDLAQLVRRNLGELLTLQAQVQVQQEAGADAAQRLSAAEQRSLALASENARLRQQLELATRKLEAIAELEKALATRPTGSEKRP